MKFVQIALALFLLTSYVSATQGIPALREILSFEQKTEIFTNELHKVLNEYTQTHQNFTENLFYAHLRNRNGSLLCNSCKDFVLAELHGLESKGVIELLMAGLSETCAHLIHLNSSLCSGFLERWTTVIWDALMGRYHKPDVACAKMQFCPYDYEILSLESYIEDILKDAPNKKPPTPTKTSSYNVLHITDLHVDYTYTTGNNANCNEPLCCREENGPTSNPADAAQYWGTISVCDIPYRTLDQFFQFVVRQNMNIDFIIWTGDNIAHNIWEQTENTQADTTLNISQALKNYFPNTPVYPIFGNHECFPADECDLRNESYTWLTTQLSQTWTELGWLDNQSANSFIHNSFYSIYNQEHNLKIISIDTQACNTGDVYLLYDPTDPMGQLAWLRGELSAAEQNNQSVFIMGHIPPGYSGCDSSWSARFNALVERYSYLIRGQFYGHTHNDQIEIVRSLKDKTPIGAYFVAPSLTTFEKLKPSFRVFEVDSATNTPINYYQYRLDLDKWNQNTTGPIDWDIAYDMLSQYNLTDMSFESLGGLVEAMYKDQDLMNLYVYHFMSGAVPLYDVKPVEVKSYYCQANFGIYADAVKCLGPTYVEDWATLIGQHIAGPWYTLTEN
jgi:sphingomyelin phosphodiesterase